MNFFLSILILIFSLQSWSKADDIRDFQIEGMSVGDSLLNYINENEIKKQQNLFSDKGFIYKSKKYYALTFSKSSSLNLVNYYQVQIHLKNNDKEYVIKSISGLNKMDSKNCYKKIDIISDELNSLFENTKKTNKQKRKHSFDKTGKSSTTDIYYFLKDGSSAAVVCTDWTENIIKTYPGYWDHLRLSLSSNEFNIWLRNEAY